jgi:ferredoxin-NADP reductase
MGSSYIHNQVHVGDALEVSAPRGTFTLQPGKTPVVLASAGVGATPVLAMLHSLSAIGSHREIWWLYGAPNGSQHPFAGESRELIKTLLHGQSHIVYSKPKPEDQPGKDYDSAGHFDISLLERLGLNRKADFYLCGPPSFLRDFSEGLKTWGADPSRVRSEVFGPEEAITPGIKPSVRPHVHVPSGPPRSGPRISFARSGLSVPCDSRFISLLELAEACDVPVRWSCRSGVSHTCESAPIGGTLPISPPRWNYPPRATSCPAVHNLLAI